MLKATIYDLALFENFLSIVNKFVQQCQFELNTKGVNVFCKNPISFASARLLLDTDVIKLNENQAVDSVKICIRDVIAFKSAISIVQQLEDATGIEIGLDNVGTDEDMYVKSIRYKSKNGASFNLITIDFDVIKDFISKDTSVVLKQDWKFNINPKNLDMAQNRTNSIVNLDEVSVYIYPKEKDGNAIVELASKQTASINSISIPISNKSVGSLDGFSYQQIAIHESSFRLFNILKVTDENNLNCFFNCENNLFFINSKFISGEFYIHSRLFVQMVKGK